MTPPMACRSGAKAGRPREARIPGTRCRYLSLRRPHGDHLLSAPGLRILVETASEYEGIRAARLFNSDVAGPFDRVRGQRVSRLVWCGVTIPSTTIHARLICAPSDNGARAQFGLGLQVYKPWIDLVLRWMIFPEASRSA